MPTEEQIKKVMKLIEARYQPHQCGWTEFRSSGHDTDVFNDGFECGQSTLLHEIGCILGMKLEEPDEQVYDF